jgi:hypothetical protein
VNIKVSKKIPSALVLLLVSLCASLFAEDTESLWKADSPNGSFTAAARRIPDKSYVWREDLDGFRLVIFSLKPGSERIPGRLYFHRDFAERVPVQMQWSPNSRFLVLTTTSSGGHSPWHYTTYVLSIDRRQVLSPDETVGPIVRPDFAFKSPDTVILEVGKRAGEAVDFEHPTKIDMNLSRFFSGKK